MIREIVKDHFILSQKSVDATIEDKDVAYDLLDTLKANEDRCVGMAANMIGILKRVIVVKDEDKSFIMFNPVIVKTSGRYYETKEGCLSHDGEKSVKRYEKIKVEYRDMDFKKKIKTYEGYTAQIIQHEIDHLEGILI